ncbi:hypothetical protein KB557_09380, partial [Synechococcus sp. Cruz CV12-2-Slac-r]|nr:hypothetical protein [Synechococcus sp. Cruz CV12-2-Slac-r]
APRCLLAEQGAAGYCGVDLSTGRHDVEKPGIDHAEPPRPCDDAPGSEVSRRTAGAPRGATSSYGFAGPAARASPYPIRRLPIIALAVCSPAQAP